MKKEKEILKERVQERWSLLMEGKGHSMKDVPRIQGKSPVPRAS